MGALLAAIGAYLIAFWMVPRQPGMRTAGVFLIIIMAMMGLANQLF